MTAQKFSDKKQPRSYFRFMLRQNWPVLVTNTIILLLMNVVFLSLEVSDCIPHHYTDSSFYSIVNMIDAWRIVNVIVVPLLAVLWGCTTMPYLNNKVGIHFYHSLPLTRGALYFREISVRVLWMAVPLALSCFFGGVMTFAIAGTFTGTMLLAFLSIFLHAMVYFLLFYSIMVFSATFTGTVFARLLGAGAIVFMPMILLLCASYIFGFNTQYSSVYWMYVLAGALFGPLRAIGVATYDVAETLPELFITIGCTLAFFLLGALIYKKRKSELSGTPVLLKSASAIIKYSALFVGATLFAIFMEDFADGTIGIFIGAVIGALLTLMLINTIFMKSAKKMFSGMRGFAVSCGAFFAVFILFGFDVIGLDTYIPATPMIQSVEVQFDGKIFTLEDRDEITEVVQIVEDRFEAGRPNTFSLSYEKEAVAVSTEEFNRINSAIENIMKDTYRIRVTFCAIGGLRFEKTYTDTSDAHLPLMTLIANSEGFVDTYFGDEMTAISSVEISYNRWSVSENAGSAQRIYETMRSSYNGSEYFNRPLLATASFYSPYNYVPYFEDAEEAIDVYLDNVRSVIVVNTKTGARREYKEKSDLEKIFSSAVLARDSVAAFTPKDETYAFVAIYGNLAEGDFLTGRFLKGHLPALPNLP